MYSSNHPFQMIRQADRLPYRARLCSKGTFTAGFPWEGRHADNAEMPITGGHIFLSAVLSGCAQLSGTAHCGSLFERS